MTAVQSAARTPALADRLKRDGVEPAAGTPQAFATLITKEIAQWRNLAQSAKITLD
jgi:tripartite-type tricarboxylate transporter receptor subunit TctC